jgi:phospholipid-binding lipoprotein MlaA
MVLLVLPVFLMAEDDGGFDDLGEFEQGVQDQVEAAQIPDPLEPLNRGVFWLNDKLYFYVLKPVSTVYSKVVPEFGRKSIANAFDNLQAPERFVNNVLQMKPAEAGTELKRFVYNSTVGVLGLRDPATDKHEIEENPEDFGQTLAHYGVDPMMTVHLPFFGPSNLRDTVGMIPDMFLSPISYIESWTTRLAVRSEKVVNDTSLRLGLYEQLKEEHDDLYSFLQNAYEQRRSAQIKE